LISPLDKVARLENADSAGDCDKPVAWLAKEGAMGRFRGLRAIVAQAAFVLAAGAVGAATATYTVAGLHATSSKVLVVYSHG